jgi:hypothetical protein
MKDYIIIKKEICAKQNRKHIKRAVRDIAILGLASYAAIFAFVEILFFIWR